MRGPHSASFLYSSFTVAPWLLIALPAGSGLERTAAIWGFWKALLLGKADTVSLRTTLVISKFNLLIEVVTTSTYHFSSSAWLGAVIGLVNSTPDMVVEVVWVAASIRLASCPIGRSSTWGLVEGTMVYILSEVVTCTSWAPARPDFTLPRLVGVDWGHQLILPGSIHPKPWMTSCLEKMMCSFTLSLSQL